MMWTEMTATLASIIPPKFKVHEGEEIFLLLKKKLDSQMKNYSTLQNS
jgi:hypothetical protein